MYRERVA